MARFCPTCGKQLQFENAEICPNCGVRIKKISSPIENRNTFLAVILSFIFVGWGQWYNGKTWEGIKFFGSFFGSFLLAIIFSLAASSQPSVAIFALILYIAMLVIWIYGMYDAYKTAERINHGEESFSGKRGLFWLPVVMLVLAVILIIAAAVIAAFVFGMSGDIQKTKVVALTVIQQGNSIILTDQGGMDHSLVSKYIISIGSLNYEWNSPHTGDQKILSGGTSGSDHVTVVAEFTDGSKQVVLDTYV
jgi:hypothetical protein